MNTYTRIFCSRFGAAMVNLLPRVDSRMLNLGCGQRFHDSWVNVDFVRHSEGVIEMDLSEGILFSDSEFDAVYHSHLLEHFTPDVGEAFQRECYRVVRPGGIVRVVVPDLEQIVRLYLDKLEMALSGVSTAADDYDWLMIELYDQTVRSKPGGLMKRYLDQEIVPNKEFIATRMGWLSENSDQEKVVSTSRIDNHRSSAWMRFFRLKNYREKLIQFMLKDEYATLKLGRFRLSGEIHAWMYDRFSLSRLLRSAGFVDIRRCEAHESSIKDWGSFELDVNSDGSVRKPDSLFMECRKPR